MDNRESVPLTMDDYIRRFPKPVQEKLEAIRRAVAALAPDAQEKIAYRMPTFTLNGTLVHFAAFKNHIGFYPTPRGIEEFQEELSRYKNGRGSVQFPLGETLPMGLIRRMIKFRIAKNRARSTRPKES